MNELTSEQVLAALRQVRHPHRGDDVVSLGMISGVVVKNGNVGFAIEVDPARGAGAGAAAQGVRAGGPGAARRALLRCRADRGAGAGRPPAARARRRPWARRSGRRRRRWCRA